MVAAIVIIAVLLIIIAGPGLWAKSVIKRHQAERADYPGTGGEFARHLIDIAGLEGVSVEMTEKQGDHYDPTTRTVRLSEPHMHGKSLAAVTIAAHEVGHALQHRDDYWAFRMRGPLVAMTNYAVMFATFGAALSPILAALLKAPGISLLMLVVMVATLILSAVTRLVTLPVEFDASFGRALPILERGQFVSPEDMKPARELLTAAAMTYVGNWIWSMLILLRQVLPFLRYLR